MKQKFTITGLDCPNCAAKLAKMMENIDGVESAKINFLTEKLTVESSLRSKAILSSFWSEMAYFWRIAFISSCSFAE